MVVVPPPTTTTSTEAVQVPRRLAQTTEAATVPTIIINMVAVREAQPHVPTIGGGYSTNYYNQYGSSTGSARTRSDIGGGYTTNYYDQYGSSIGSSTTRSNIGGGTTTTYYDAYGSSIGTSYDW